MPKMPPLLASLQSYTSRLPTKKNFSEKIRRPPTPAEQCEAAKITDGRERGDEGGIGWGVGRAREGRGGGGRSIHPSPFFLSHR